MDDGATSAGSGSGRSVRAGFPIDPDAVDAAIGGGEGSGSTPTMQAVGALVRRLRDEARLSLATLAASAELSPGLLSQIERGRGNPSFTTLVKLAHALNVPVGRFFVSEQKAGSLVRAGEHPRLLLAEDNLVYELLTPHMNGRLGMIRARVNGGWSNESEPFIHDGEECVLLVRGELRVNIAGDLYVMNEGDSITYDAGLPHWYHNPREQDAELIGAMSPPSF